MDLIFRAKDHEVASYETEQIVDVPGAEDMQSGGKPCAYWLKGSLLFMVPLIHDQLFTKF